MYVAVSGYQAVECLYKVTNTTIMHSLQRRY